MIKQNQLKEQPQYQISKKTLLTTAILITAFGALALANEEAAGEAHAGLNTATIKVIIYQAINVALIIVGLVYFLKDGVRKAFAKKRADFLSAAEKSKRALQEAERAKSELEVKLHKLESTADESITRAKTEAAELRAQLIAEATNLSNHLKKEAASAAQGEVEKAKRQLREELLGESFKLAEQGLSSKVSTEDHNRLQGEFITNIEAVQR